MISKNNLIITLLFTLHCASAQSYDDSPYDSLSGKSFEYLSERCNATVYDRKLSKIYVDAWLRKAKSEKDNYCQLALAYKASIINADKKLRLIYADSMIAYANLSDNAELIGSSYLTKGIIHYDNMENKKALDHYLIADKYLSQTNNPYLRYKIKYGIAHIKYYLGFYDEAISLLRECIVYFRDENDRAYLNSLRCLALCYSRIGNYQLATLINQTGIAEGRQFEDTGIEFYFVHAEGINECLKGDYAEAIEKLTSALPKVINMKDSANEALAYFYLGKSYWSLRQYAKAVRYFKKVDCLFEKEKFTLPDLRKGYEYLIDYYKQHDDTASQLMYINQLLKTDRQLTHDYQYLLKKIVKDYDTKELMDEKKAIENTILYTRIISCLLTLSMAFMIGYLMWRNKRNKKLFEELMALDTSNTSPRVENSIEENEPETELKELNEKRPSNDINPEIEAAVLKKLEKFEHSRKYLEKDMTLAKMATILHTNSKYVTKIIVKHRGKGTIEYITHLKVNYIIEMLKTESKYRNYTYKALGEEAGFGSTQNFTRAFKTYTGLTPSYFISELKKLPTEEDHA